MAERKFKVTVNGRDYDVVVEELAGAGAPIGSAPVARPAVSAPLPTPAPAPAAPAPAAAGSGMVAAPMAGKVLKVPVKVGQKVAAGDVLVVLEAMKMETNVNAGADGEIKEVMVAEGDTVEAGAALVRCE